MNLTYREKAEAFRAAVEQFEEVESSRTVETPASSHFSDEPAFGVIVEMAGHKSAVPRQIREIAKTMDLNNPDAGSPDRRDWDHFRLHDNDGEPWTTMVFVPRRRQRSWKRTTKWGSEQ